MRFLPARPIARARLFAFALLGVVPALAGPGALVAAIALASSVGHAHHVSVQRDAGHDDILLRHAGAAREPAHDAGPTLRCDRGDPGDHRLQILHGDRMAPRSDANVDLRHATAHFALAEEPACEIATGSAAPLPAPAVSPFGPPPLARSGILQL